MKRASARRWGCGLGGLAIATVGFGCGRVPKDAGDDGAGLKICYGVEEQMAEIAKDVIKMGEGKDQKSSDASMQMAYWRLVEHPKVSALHKDVKTPLELADDEKTSYFGDYENFAHDCRPGGSAISCMVKVTTKDPNATKGSEPRKLTLHGPAQCLAKDGAVLPAPGLTWTMPQVSAGDTAYIAIEDMQGCWCAGGAKIRLLGTDSGSGAMTP